MDMPKNIKGEIPEPRRNEKQSTYMERCMFDMYMIEKYNREGERLAVCYKKWKNK